MVSRASTGVAVQPVRNDREMYVTYLRCHGVTTLAALTAREALPVVPSADVVVTGIRLPGPMDALEFVRALRRWHGTPQ